MAAIDKIYMRNFGLTYEEYSKNKVNGRLY